MKWHGFRVALCCLWAATATLLLACGSRASAQNSELFPQPLIPSAQNSAVQDKRFLRGRVSSTQPAAALRYRAYQQKMRLRQLNRSSSAKGSPTVPGPGGIVWSSIGPAPFASDASGDGQQDYNWVSGRATAVAVDPADPTGNTVYVGGAYGGLWRSANAGSASASPASVTWAALIDNQPTLSVGAVAIQPQSSNPNPNRSVILVGTGEANSSLIRITVWAFCDQLMPGRTGVP